MSCKRDRSGCLFIDDDASGRPAGEACARQMAIPGVELSLFCCGNAQRLWEELQIALQGVRAEWGACAVMAAGAGCAAALALACQLPVEKLVLIDPVRPGRLSRAEGMGMSPDAIRRHSQLRRLAAFARRNLPLCVSDLLVIGHARREGEDALRRAYGNPVNCSVQRLVIPGESDKDLYTIREFAVKEAISRFLHPEETLKPLAENSEMCIIYG